MGGHASDRERETERERGRGRSGDVSAIAADPRFHEWERGDNQRKVWGYSDLSLSLLRFSLLISFWFWKSLTFWVSERLLMMRKVWRSDLLVWGFTDREGRERELIEGVGEYGLAQREDQNKREKRLPSLLSGKWRAQWTQFHGRSLYCLIIRTVSFCSSSRNKVADPQAIKNRQCVVQEYET
ncbi:uncharacterized protein [Malus domestica]|uniref:uncharacterized protein isoform X1 n=1 Tax=Malus domestica TaxID=3750 RepID=UPI0039758712